jgi:beta-glucosidase
MMNASLLELSRRFPRDFVWGVATSAFQIEGARGRGTSIWDDFCRQPGAIADGSNGDVACDHYNRVEADLDLIAGLGVRAYRFSIAWPRVQPDGRGAWNQAGLDFYDRLVDGLLERNILPYATLYHWDLPATLQKQQDGWYSRDTAYLFRDYAAMMAKRLGDRVASIATHNEPWVSAVLGHEQGIFAPGIRNRRVAYQVGHHVLLSHGLAAQAMRDSGTRADVGIVLNWSPVYPATQSVDDIAMARLEDGTLVRWYLDALLRGQYPSDVLEHLGADAPRVSEGDHVVIAQKLDFVGMNYYHPMISRSGNPSVPASHGAEVTDMGWEVAPGGLSHLLQRLSTEYSLPPVFITENGAAYKDEIVDGRVEDEERRAYIESHLNAVADAMHSGVDVRGYFLWSLLDNFEWASGYQKRFGIVHVDYATQLRTLKRSGHWYRSLMQACVT